MKKQRYTVEDYVEINRLANLIVDRKLSYFKACQIAGMPGNMLRERSWESARCKLKEAVGRIKKARGISNGPAFNRLSRRPKGV